LAIAIRPNAGCRVSGALGPNDLKLYKGSQFPKPYAGGAFIAFHGSWNRAPGRRRL